MRIKLLVCFICAAFILQSCRKEAVPPENKQSQAFSLANIFQNNMVIQRDKAVNIWGNATSGSKIIVNVSWNSIPFTTTANGGSWKVNIPAAPANSQPQTISAKVDGKEPVTRTNILIGDVWVCSGQSNMVMPVGAVSPFMGVVKYQEEIANANYPQIRAFTTTISSELLPASNFTNSTVWDVCSPATVGNMSAVAYFFARKLTTELNVPIGIIVSAINGAYCDEWMNDLAFQSDASLASYSYTGNGRYYNGMISPLTNLSVKGFLWYQGENDAHRTPVLYTKLNSALINGWRSAFKQGALPFYYVQMTPFDETNTGDITLNDYARFREAQANIRRVANTGMAITMDVGEVANHHPINKKPVGERLALLALKNDYGKNAIAVGPQFLSISVTGNKATVSFASGTADGLATSDNAPPKHFYIAGIDQVFRPGTAVINGSQIVVTAPADTPLPIQAVRYAFTNFPVTNVQNSAGLPMEPFRTDNWSN